MGRFAFQDRRAVQRRAGASVAGSGAVGANPGLRPGLRRIWLAHLTIPLPDIVIPDKVVLKTVAAVPPGQLRS